MKFIRRKVVRDVVDVVKDEANGTYLVQTGEGVVKVVTIAEFEAQYDPLLRDRTKPAKAQKRKAKHAAAPAEVVPS